MTELERQITQPKNLWHVLVRVLEREPDAVHRVVLWHALEENSVGLEWTIGIEYAESEMIHMAYHPADTTVREWIKQGLVFPEMNDKEHKIQSALGTIAPDWRRYLIQGNEKQTNRNFITQMELTGV